MTAARQVVELDPSVADWQPDCFNCGAALEWSQAVALPASQLEDGEPTGLLLVCKSGCSQPGGQV